MTGLEALNILARNVESLEIDTFYECKGAYQFLEKSLKALEIIKEKDVDVSWLKYCIKENMIVEAYNSGYPEYHKHLTEEEFNLLKEVLK